MSENKITACLVVRNEERIIQRCMDSVVGAVSEIIVVHDGECGDRTLDICRKYGVKIFIRPFAGAMEAHLPFIFEQAGSDWILRIDADEFLSENLRNKLNELAMADNVGGYEFLWPLWNGERYISRLWPHKLCLFKKKHAAFLGVVHFQPIITGKIIKSELILEHRPSYNNFTWEVFGKKWLKWARIQANMYLKNFKDIEKFNYNKNDWPFKIKLRIKFPIILIPVEFFLTFLKNLSSGGYREGAAGLRVAIMFGVYRIMVNYYIWQIKNTNK